jgi:hypothetical protein
MTDRLDAIEADLERPEVLNTENGCSVANVGSGDVRWLVAEVRRLRETHAAAVKSAYLCGLHEAFTSPSADPEQCWQLSAARRGLAEKGGEHDE